MMPSVRPLNLFKKTILLPVIFIITACGASSPEGVSINVSKSGADTQNKSAGITLSRSQVKPNDTFSFKLNTKPTSEVTVNFDVQPSSTASSKASSAYSVRSKVTPQGSISASLNNLRFEPASVTIQPENWNQPVTVKLVQIDANVKVVSGIDVRLIIKSNDPKYAGLPPQTTSVDGDGQSNSAVKTIVHFEGVRRILKLDESVSYQISGADAGEFEIVTANYLNYTNAKKTAFDVKKGRYLSFKQSPDYETDKRVYAIDLQGNTKTSYEIVLRDVSTGSFLNYALPASFDIQTPSREDANKRKRQTNSRKLQDREYVKVNAEGLALSDQFAGGHSCVVEAANDLWWEVKHTPADGKPLTESPGSRNGQSLQDPFDWYVLYDKSRNITPSRNKKTCYIYDKKLSDFGGAVAGEYSNNLKCRTEDYVRVINKLQLCGHTDWRVPTGDNPHHVENGMKFSGSNFYQQRNTLSDKDYVAKGEIRSLLRIVGDTYTSGPYVDADYFPNTRKTHYMSSSMYKDNIGTDLGDIACGFHYEKKSWWIYFGGLSQSQFTRTGKEVSGGCKLGGINVVRLVRSSK